MNPLLLSLLIITWLTALNGPAFPLNREGGPAPDRAELIQFFSQSLDPDDFENPEDWEAYIQELLDLFPVDPNTATRSDLLLIPGMTDRLADGIVSFRAGQPIRSFDDLAGVPGIGPSTLEMLRPWVKVHDRRRQNRNRYMDIDVRQYFRFQQSFPTPAGYASREDGRPHYVGSPARIYHRQTIATPKLSANLTQVKLPGERLNGPFAFDFTTAHLAYQSPGVVRRVVLGDYSARFGQGLVLWSSASFGKGGPSHSAPFRRSQGIRPYGSTGQIRFFRGAAVETALPVPRRMALRGHRLSVSAMHSHRRRSAAVVSGDTIRPLSSSPFHRTESERERRHNVRETVRAGNVSWRHSVVRLGTTMISYRLDRPVVPHPVSSPMAGQAHLAWGVDISVSYRDTRFFGEHAWRHDEGTPADHPRNTAWLAGFMWSYPEGADWVLALRRYGSGYRTEFAGVFGEGSGTPTNQSGWYTGFRLRMSDRLRLSGYVDRFRFPVPARNHIRPTDGWEVMLLAQYRQRPRLEYQAAVRYKMRTTERDVPDAFRRMVRVSGTAERMHARFQTNWQVHRLLFLRARLESSVTSATPENSNRGTALSASIRWKAASSFRTDLGWSFFDTDDFSSRLYHYEYDLTTVMTSRMLHGLGRTAYAVIRWQPASWMLAEFKYARIRYFDRPVTGSGYDQTPGPVRSETGIQLRLAY